MYFRCFSGQVMFSVFYSGVEKLSMTNTLHMEEMDGVMWKKGVGGGVWGPDQTDCRQKQVCGKRQRDGGQRLNVRTRGKDWAKVQIQKDRKKDIQTFESHQKQRKCLKCFHTCSLVSVITKTHQIHSAPKLLLSFLNSSILMFQDIVVFLT